MPFRGYVGVVGPGAAAPELVEQAAEVGRLLAGRGLVVVTGGLGGVMAGAARGAAEAGGTSLGLLPGHDRAEADPSLTLTVPTGLGEMRNALLVRCCDAVVAVGTSWGTLSEVALAARTGVPVVLLGEHLLAEMPAGEQGVRQPVGAATAAAAVAEVVRLLRLGEDAVSAWVLGVDRQRGTWVGALLPVVDGAAAGEVELIRGPDLATLVGTAQERHPVALVAVDIPVGLPDTGVRRADVLVRARLGPRASSVFPTPVRDALAAPTYAEARAVSVARTGGRSLAAQSYGLRAAVLDVDSYVRGPEAGRPRVVEVHPELCFAAMAGAPLATSKKTPEGIAERVRLLAAHGIRPPAELDLARPGADDVLDAAAAAWSAGRVLTGRAERVPAEPERFSDGLDAAMWV